MWNAGIDVIDKSFNQSEILPDRIFTEFIQWLLA
jgi:hypothetical protein